MFKTLLRTKNRLKFSWKTSNAARQTHPKQTLKSPEIQLKENRILDIEYTWRFVTTTFKKSQPKKILATQAVVQRYLQMKAVVMCPNSSKSQRGPGIFLTETPPTKSTQTPLRSLLPVLRSPHKLSQQFSF